MAGAQPSGRRKLIEGGVILVLIGLLSFGVSFAAGNDAEDPRCNGREMTAQDLCISSRSGTQTYDDRAQSAAAASTWTLRIGGALAGGGALLLVIGILTPKNRDHPERRP